MVGDRKFLIVNLVGEDEKSLKKDIFVGGRRCARSGRLIIVQGYAKNRLSQLI